MFFEKFNCDYNMFYDKKEFENVTNLVICSRSTNIFLEKGIFFTAKYTGDCPNNTRPIIHHEIKSNVLTINVDKDGHVDESMLVVTIPDTVNSIDIFTISGCCIITKDIKTNSLKISTTTGNVDSNCSAKNIDINVPFGNVSLYSNTNYINVKTNTGNISVILDEKLKEAKLESVSGHIEILLMNKNIQCKLESLCGNIKSKIQNNHNSNVFLFANSITGNIIIN